MKEDLIQLLNATAKELETILNSKTVVGAPITLDGSTVIPLISVGFGLGVGGGSGKDPKKGEGGGSGFGCGGGVKPVAVVISDAQGVRVEAIKGGMASAVENMAKTLGRVVRKEEGGESSE